VSGAGVVFPRDRWSAARAPRAGRTGARVLVDDKERDGDLPTLYSGEGYVVRDRVERRQWPQHRAMTGA